MQFSRKVAVALEKTVECKRIGVSVIGLPLNSMDDARFINKVSLEKEEFEALAKAINLNL